MGPGPIHSPKSPSRKRRAFALRYFAYYFPHNGPVVKAGAAMRTYRHVSGTESPLINGAHVVIYSKDSEADQAFFRDVLKFPCVDAGHGWLIFVMPPLEAAFHDSEKNDQHELFLMCDDLAATLRDLKSKQVTVSEVSEQRWGRLATFALLGVARWVLRAKTSKPTEAIGLNSHTINAGLSRPSQLSRAHSWPGCESDRGVTPTTQSWHVLADWEARWVCHNLGGLSSLAHS